MFHPVSGVVLPVLGALPDSLIILTSLSSASQAEAQEAVAVGIGGRTLRGGALTLSGRRPVFSPFTHLWVVGCVALHSPSKAFWRCDVVQ